MASCKFNDDIIIDVLKEIGNIGSGNAVTALASMLSKSQHECTKGKDHRF